MKYRWDKLVDSLYNPKTDEFDLSKIPDVYDCIKYDVLHNEDFFQKLRPLYQAIKAVADFVVPQEYGVLRQEKLDIGIRIVKPLLRRIIHNLESGLDEEPESRVHLYFSSESHLHSLRNVFLLSGLPSNNTCATTLEAIELNYMSHGVLRLFEDPSKALDDPWRFYVNVLFSPGCSLDPFTFKKDGHILPVSRPTPVNGKIPLDRFKELFDFVWD